MHIFPLFIFSGVLSVLFLNMDKKIGTNLATQKRRLIRVGKWEEGGEGRERERERGKLRERVRQFLEEERLGKEKSQSLQNDKQVN